MHQISDGERRRVQLCMGLMGEWDVLLLDEVTVDLDVLVRSELIDYLVGESETRGATIVCASSPSFVLTCCDSGLSLTSHLTCEGGGLTGRCHTHIRRPPRFPHTRSAPPTGRHAGTAARMEPDQDAGRSVQDCPRVDQGGSVVEGGKGEEGWADEGAHDGWVFRFFFGGGVGSGGSGG